MPTNQPLLQELEQEVIATGRLLDRLPADRLAWRPHPKSMTLGQLALHVATIPASYHRAISLGTTQASEIATHPECTSLEQIKSAWQSNLLAARKQLRTEAADDSDWSLESHGKPLLTLPKSVARRLLMLNHWYHHRGQWTVYLRLLDIPVPSVYGPSADENPWEEVMVAGE